MKVCDHIRKSGDYKLARAVDSARSSHARMISEPFDLSDDLKDGFDGGPGIVSADIFLDRIEVAASGERPL
jgi:hypothetical protein